MSDIATVWDGPLQASGDWQIAPPDLLSGNDLQTAVLISIFSDRTALPSNTIPDGTTDPRGWWGDAAQYPVGSRLWLLSRAKQTRETLQAAQSYIVEALKWLIDDGVAAAVEVGCAWTQPTLLGARIVVLRTDGTTQTMNFGWAWSQHAV